MEVIWTDSSDFRRKSAGGREVSQAPCRRSLGLRLRPAVAHEAFEACFLAYEGGQSQVVMEVDHLLVDLRFVRAAGVQSSRGAVLLSNLEEAHPSPFPFACAAADP